MVDGMELTYNEIRGMPDMNFFGAKTASHTVPPRKNEKSYLNLTLESSCPKEVKLTVTIDDVTPRSIDHQ